MIAFKYHVQKGVESGFMQACQGNGFIPFRRDIQFFDYCAVSILPLIPYLDFIENKGDWGYIFRFGLWEIHKPDFGVVASLMLPNREIIKGVKVDFAEKSGISV